MGAVTVDLARWIGEQLDEDARIARAATAGPWRAHDTHLGQYGYAATVLSGDGNDTDLRAWLPSMSNEPWDEKRNVWADAEHIAAHDPARVLREVEAKRVMVNVIAPAQAAALDAEHGCCHEGEAILAGDCPNFPPSDLPLLRLLALPYVDRDGYQEGWAP